jgi:hypothetical protein
MKRRWTVVGVSCAVLLSSLVLAQLEQTPLQLAQAAKSLCAGTLAARVDGATASVNVCVAAIDAVIASLSVVPVPVPVPTPSPVPSPSPSPTGTTYTISKSGPLTTITAGIAKMKGGDTLVISDGTWAEAFPAPPSGNDGAWTIVRAEHPGLTILTGNCCTARTTHHVVFSGLRVQSTNQKDVLGNHLKFQEMEFRGGCASGNCTDVAVGTNDFNDTADILIEDSWIHGAGGRYNLLVYNANRVILRRVVLRHDGGWTDSKGDPEAGLSVYNSANVAVENVLCLDSNLSYHTWQSCFYSVYNSASPNSNRDNSWLGVVALNNTSGADGASLRFDGNVAQTGHVIADAVFWQANWGMNMSYAAAVSLTATRLTIGRPASGMIGIAGSSGGTKRIDNLRVFNASVLNGSPTNQVSGPPMYLPQPLNGTGADVTKQIGVAGSLYGETGWNTPQSSSLWPWPNEARLKVEMCAGVTRGFCSDSSLTHYIWNYLGNGSPF